MSPTRDRIVTVMREGKVAVLTLCRPESMNAISMQMRADLRETLDELRRDDAIGAAVITGSGDRAFSAGMDLREFAAAQAAMSVVEMKRYRWQRGEGIDEFDKPILAAVNGLAIGGGVELALLCDMVFASERASFAFAEITRGLMPGNGGTQRLTRRIGAARALELILSGRTVGAQEALKIGLVEYVVPDADLLSQAIAVAAKMADNAPVAIRMAKAAIQRGAELSLQDGIRLEQDLATLLYTTEDAVEGPRAYLEKRAPVWRNR